MLSASVADDTTDSKRRLNRQTKCQRFAKLKELFFQRAGRYKNTTFNFAQPHPRLLTRNSKGDFADPITTQIKARSENYKTYL
jgi:hypothetical protein